VETVRVPDRLNVPAARRVDGVETVRVARGVYVPEDDAALGSVCASLLSAMPSGSVISGLTAAQLHGLWLPPQPADGPLDVTIVAGATGSERLAYPRRREVSAHRRTFGPGDVVTSDRVPVTSVARTWLDLAHQLSLPDLVAAGDSALRGDNAVSMAQLAMLVEATPDRRGIRLARRALAMLDSRSRSRPESHLRVAVTAPDLPRFRVNEPIADENGEWLAEPDLALDEAMLALEYQGEGHADPVRMRRDMTRVTDMRRAGWQVLMYGPAEVLRRPHMIAPEIRQILRMRAPHLLAVPRRTPRLGT
jgi:very-short-patch-repair endonuclease